jgi:hypothetical protein
VQIWSRGRAAALSVFNAARQVDDRRVDDQQVDARQVDDRRVDDQQVDARQVDDRRVDDRQVDARQVDDRRVDARQVDGKRLKVLAGGRSPRIILLISCHEKTGPKAGLFGLDLGGFVYQPYNLKVPTAISLSPINCKRCPCLVKTKALPSSSGISAKWSCLPDLRRLHECLAACLLLRTKHLGKSLIKSVKAFVSFMINNLHNICLHIHPTLYELPRNLGSNWGTRSNHRRYLLNHKNKERFYKNNHDERRFLFCFCTY